MMRDKRKAIRFTAADPASSQAADLPGTTSSTRPDVTEALDRIDYCRRLPGNWDGESGLPISEEVASRATELLTRVAERAGVVGLQRSNPAIAPNPDGALELSWEIGDRWVLLVIGAGQPEVDAVRQSGDLPPQSQRLQEEE